MDQKQSQNPKPEMRNPLMDIRFDDEPVDDVATQKIDWLAVRAQKEGIDIDPKVAEYFKDPAFFNSLPLSIRDDEEVLFSYLKNSSRFDDIISPERNKSFQKEAGLLGENVVLENGLHADGRQRRVEEGHLVHLDYLHKVNIDPSKVLVFRVTQPSDAPKPEYYWTTDLFETKRGLRKEIRVEDRKTSVILVSDLNTISQNDGLIQDVNDDNGMSFRQKGLHDFDQKKCISIIKNINE